MSSPINRRSNNFSGSRNTGDKRRSRNQNFSKPKNSKNDFSRNNLESNFNVDDRKRKVKNRSSYNLDQNSYRGNTSKLNNGRYSQSDEYQTPPNSASNRRINHYGENRIRSQSRKYYNEIHEQNIGNSLHQNKTHQSQRNSYDQEYSDKVIGNSNENDLLWGRHATQSALEIGRPIHRIWCTSEIRSSPKFLQLLRDAKASGVLVEEVTWARLGQLTFGAVHQGIVLQTAAAETLDLKSLVKGCSEIGEAPLLVALDGLTDPQNLGAIVRSAEALGAHGMVLPQRRSAGLTGSVAKVAAGALEHLPVARVVNLNRSLEVLKKEGYTVVGLAEEGDFTISEIDLEGPLVVVTGSEGKGISLLTKKHCDQLVRIPLRGVTTSLNASVATALVLYEVARRGWMKSISGQAPSPKLVRAKYSSSIE